MPDQIQNLAYQLLEQPIEPIPRYRLLRDVLQWPEDHLDMIIARDMVLQSKYVLELEEAQHDDGSFGRFLYEQIPVRNALRSTEAAICRALALGIGKDHPVLQKAAAYMAEMLDGRKEWPDKIEDTPGQEIGARLILAACLRSVDRKNELALEEARKWEILLNIAFSNGEFNETEYLNSFEDIMGRRAIGKTQLLFSRYLLMLMPDLLNYQLERQFVGHIINNYRGLFFVTNHSLRYQPLQFPSREGMRYIRAYELLASYPGAADIMRTVYDWIWEQRTEDGLWDFTYFARDGMQLPLSSNWRQNRKKIDCSVRMLSLLNKMQDTCDLQAKICHTI